MTDVQKFLDTTYDNAFFINFLSIYYTPIIIIFGFVGNILSCIVFLSARHRKQSSSHYLAALAITDTISIIILVFIWFRTLEFDLFKFISFCQASLCKIALVSFVLR